MEQKKVLVIDDEPLMVKSTCMALRYHGFDAHGELDGPAGIEAATLKKPDAILLDIMMPNMDGWEVLLQLKAQEATRTIPVIIFTAREYSNGNSLATEKGAADYVAKPFELDDLIDVINRHLTIKKD